MAKRKKKAKGFKVSDSFVCFNYDNKLFLLSLAHNSLEKCVKTTQIPSEKCEKFQKVPQKSVLKGEYCPKVTGCCWDYTQKKKTQKQEEEETKNAA